MPQKQQTDLLLWNLEDLSKPVHAFVGHQDTPREFVWQKKEGKESLLIYRFFLYGYLVKGSDIEVVACGGSNH